MVAQFSVSGAPAQVFSVSSASALPTREAYTAIEFLYDFFNRELFSGQLPACLFTFQRQPRVMGYFSRKRWINQDQTYVDELAINPEYFYGSPLEELCQTIVHEQCHVWQYHFGTPSRTGYHNKEWADKMEALGLMPSTTGLPGGGRVGQKMDDYILASGPLHEAIKTLSNQGFKLSWVDTIPAFRSPRAVKVFDGAGCRTAASAIYVIGSTPQPASALVPLAAAEAEPATGVVGDPTLSVSGEIKGGSPWEPDAVMALPVECVQLTPLPAMLKKPQTRVKYRCGCDNQVWGRPRLDIGCNTCGGRFQESV